MQIVPPINLCKNRIENWNKIGFKKKLKNETKDYFLDFNIVTKFQNFKFIKRYVVNKNNNKNIDEKNKVENNLQDNNFDGSNTNNNDKFININDNYV